MMKIVRGVWRPFHHYPPRTRFPEHSTTTRAHPGAASTPLPRHRATKFAFYRVAWSCTMSDSPESTPDHRSLCIRAKGRTNSRSAASASSTSTSRDPKPCKTCGREITWRKKWERCWDDVQYCSQGCRKNKPGDEGRCGCSAYL